MIEEEGSEFITLAEIAKSKDNEAMNAWLKQKEGREEFVKKLMEPGNQAHLSEFLMQESRHAREQCDALKGLRKRLHINIADDALAYAFTNDNKGFSYFLRLWKDVSPVEYANAVSLFEHIKTNLIVHEGKRGALHKVKQAIDLAYAEKKDFFEIAL